MFKVGLPDDVVKQEMVQEGVDQRIIDYVLGGGASEGAASTALVSVFRST